VLPLEHYFKAKKPKDFQIYKEKKNSDAFLFVNSFLAKIG
jgi:hypothetical protein